MTTIRYCFPNNQRYKLMSFSSYDKAVKCIELLKTIDCKVELQQ